MKHYFDLSGKKGLIVGIANDKSLAWGVARATHYLGAQLAITYLNDKAKKYVEPLAQSVEAELLLPLDVENHEQTHAVFERLTQHWGQLDFLVHSIAFAPAGDLHGPVLDSSAAGFARTLDVSCHSFARLGQLAAPLMTNGGSLITMTYLGADKVVPHYGLMGVAKAALEALVRYLAVELGPRHIRVNAISPGPVLTRAASGIDGFAQLLENTRSHNPLPHQVTPLDVGLAAAALLAPAGRLMTGNVIYVDAGEHVL